MFPLAKGKSMQQTLSGQSIEGGTSLSCLGNVLLGLYTFVYATFPCLGHPNPKYLKSVNSKTLKSVTALQYSQFNAIYKPNTTFQRFCLAG